MATPAKTKRTTSATVKADLKKKGYRLPHGYDVIKRKPKAKKVVKRKTTTSKKK